MRANRPVWMVIGCGLVQLCLLHGGVRAESAKLESNPPDPFHSVVLGAIADAGIGTSADGDTLMFEIGGQWAGVKTFGDRRWFLQWDALVAARGGYLANQHPYFFLIGGHEIGWAEGGYRVSASKRWSPYLGGRLGDDARILIHPGLPLSALDTVNNVDRVGGAGGTGLIRVDVGASFLDANRSLLLVAFVQETFQSSEINTGSQTFTGAGIGGRFDIAGRLTASVEVVRGVSPTRTDPLRGLTDRTTRTGGSAACRKVFRNRMWLSASVFLERDTDHVVYGGGGASYDTGNAPVFGLTLLYGLPLWNNWSNGSSWRKP